MTCADGGVAVARRDSHSRSGPRFWVGLCAAAILLRFPAVLWPLKPDEAGFLLVARSWAPDATSLYGHYWVDRPPGLIAAFKIADELLGAFGPRVVAALLAAAAVFAAYRIGVLIGGAVWGRWSAVFALVLFNAPYLSTWTAKSESLGVPFVMVSCWLAIEGLHASSARLRHGAVFGAGLAGGLAMCMKQNLAGGVVFGAIMLGAHLWTRRIQLGEVARLFLSAAAGLAVPIAAVIAWAVSNGVGLDIVWSTLYEFRSAALELIADNPSAANERRALTLVLLFVVTGMALGAGWFAVNFRAVFRARPEVAAGAVGLFAFDVVALALSGSYWSSNLIALIPGSVLALALTGLAETRARRIAQALIGLSIVALAIALIVQTTLRLSGQPAPVGLRTGQAVAAAAGTDDSILVLYGHAEVVEASGLQAPYEHLWSLPARTLDPGLHRMRALLMGEAPPTWIVQWDTANTWGIDHGGALRRLLKERYERHGIVCGRTVWLHGQEERAPLPDVDCGRPWTIFSPG